MVRTWNREPSPDQMKATREATARHSPTVTFQTGNPRFAYDGKVRVPNFLNGLDGQLNEARAQMAPVNTSTHTRYDFSGAGTGNYGVSMAAEVARSINTCGTMRSGRPKSATARSLVANDTRYAHLEEPHLEHVGPGGYEVERAVPGVGQLPLDSHVSSATPQRDPYRASAAFMAPERPSSATWVRPGGPDNVYISPEFVPSPDHAPPWDLTADQRPDPADWRHNQPRLLAALAAAAASSGGYGYGGSNLGQGGGGGEAPFSSDLPTDVAGRPLEVSLRASLRNPHGVSFTSKEPRLAALPPDRTADVRTTRIASLRGPEETAHLGPGAYSPPTSIGGARRRTYRLFVDPLISPQPSDRFGGGASSLSLSSVQSEAAAIVKAHDRGSARGANKARAAAAAAAAAAAGVRPSSRQASARSVGRSPTVSASGSFGAASGGPRSARSGALGSPVVGGTAAFAGTFRTQKAGAFDWRTDSSLVRH